MDPVELVEQYHRVLDFSAENPSLGSQAIATRLDLPRERIRTWIREDNSSIPDCVRGLQTAEERGWVRVMPDSDIFKGLNVLVVTILSGGSISADTWDPRFAIDGVDSLDRAVTALRWVDIEFEMIRKTDRERATEIRLKDDGRILGRVLGTLGAPVGSKASQDLSLPSYLAHVSPEHRRAFARSYVGNRGFHHTDKGILTFKEERSEAYLEQLADLLADVTQARVSRNGNNVVLSKDATRVLG